MRMLGGRREASTPPCTGSSARSRTAARDRRRPSSGSSWRCSTKRPARWGRVSSRARATATSPPCSASAFRRSAAARSVTPTTSARAVSSGSCSVSPSGWARASRRATSYRSRRVETRSSIADAPHLMIRAGLLWLSEQSRIFGFIRGNGLARRLAARFVAGETVEAAVAALQGLNASGMAASLDLLGESVTSLSEARAARDTYLETLDRIRTVGADANVSVKLTQMGLEVDERVCVENLRAIMARARSYGTFVRIDMEQSAYTENTLQLFKRTFHPEFGNVVRCMERLLERGDYPGIATHDARIIAHAKAFARRTGIAPQRFEFQMLYGVRRDLQLSLRREGYNVRVYVPFGGHWYPYLMRRLAERPANIAFLLGNIVRESLRRS